MTVPVNAAVYSQGFGTRTVSAVISSTRAPGLTDVNYPFGQRWINTTSNSEYTLTSFSTSNNVVSATWTFLGAGAGDLNTITTDDSTIVTPTAGTILFHGTSNQLVTTGSNSPGAMTIALSSTMIAPGSLEVTGLLTCDASALIKTAGTALNLATDADTAAVNIGTNTNARTITIGNNTSTTGVVVKVGTGNFAVTPAVTSTITLGAATNTGTLTLGNSTSGQTINIGNAAGPNIINVGSSSAGNITLTIASGSTFAVVGSGGTINIGTDAAANVVTVGSTTASASLTLQSGSGGNTSIAGNAAATITIGAAAQTGKISIADSTAAMPAVDLMNGVATGAQVLNIASGTSASGAQTVNLLNGTTPGASTTLNIMNGAATAGTQAVAILSSGATRAGTYNIGDGGAAHVGVIGSTTASAALTLQAGSGTTGLKLSAAGNVQMVPATNSAAGVSLTVNGRVFQATFTGQTTASGSSQAFTITNSAISGTTQAILVSADNLGSNDAQMTITRVLQAANTLTVTLKNNGAAALNGDVHITGWILN